MGVEPTRDRANGRATVLKTARPTGTLAPPDGAPERSIPADDARPGNSVRYGARPMILGACRLELQLAENHSLKGKRQLVRSVSARLRNQFNLAVAEIEEQDVWQTAVLGLACVSNESKHAHQILENAVGFVERLRLDAELADYQIELFHFV